MWIDREEEPYRCAQCGKELDETDMVVMNENMPIMWSTNDNCAMFCEECVREMFESWLEESLEDVG